MMQRLELTTGKFHLQEIKSNAHELLFALDSHCGGDFLYLCVDVMISKTCVHITSQYYSHNLVFQSGTTR